MPTDAELRALRKVKAAFERYFVHYSAEHDDDCPGDDTCECPMVLGVEEAFRELESLLRPQEPEQAARERLGVYLAETEGSHWNCYWGKGSLSFVLTNEWGEEFTAVRSFAGESDVERARAEAINAALDAAERGRT